MKIAIKRYSPSHYFVCLDCSATPDEVVEATAQQVAKWITTQEAFLECQTEMTKLSTQAKNDRVRS